MSIQLTKKQENIIRKLEQYITALHFTDKQNKARGEFESLKRSLREVEQALTSNH